MGLLGGSEGVTHGKPSEYASGDELLRGREEGGKSKLLTSLGAAAISSLLPPRASLTNGAAAGSLCSEAPAGFSCGSLHEFLKGIDEGSHGAFLDMRKPTSPTPPHQQMPTGLDAGFHSPVSGFVPGLPERKQTPASFSAVYLTHTNPRRLSPQFSFQIPHKPVTVPVCPLVMKHWSPLAGMPNLYERFPQQIPFPKTSYGDHPISHQHNIPNTSAPISSHFNS